MQRWIPVVAITLLIAAVVQVVPMASAQSSDLAGTVCDEGYGPDDCHNVLAGVTVTAACQSPMTTCLGQADRSATTDAQGQFRFSNLPGTTYELEFERVAFEPKTLAADRGEKVLVSLQGLPVTQVFEVRDRTGPIAGAEVYANGPQDSASGETNANGRVSLELTAGWYSINFESAEHYGTYAYELLDGQETRTVEMERVPDRTVTIRGQILDQDGNPVSGAQVYAHSYPYEDQPKPEPAVEPASDGATASHPADSSYRCCYGGDHQETTSDRDGRFEFKIRPGQVNVNAYLDGYQRAYDSFQAQDGETKTLDLEMGKIPDRSVPISGTIRGSDGTMLSNVQISINNVEWGTYECSIQDRDAQSSAGSAGGSDALIAPDDYHQDCVIRISSDGSFEGTVRPGYQILRVYHESWRDCEADYCPERYLSLTRTLILEEGDAQRINLVLPARAQPDATVQGYAVHNGTGVAGATIQFSNMEQYGWAHATTDADGSYKLRVHSGWHTVYVYADGYFQYEETIFIEPDETTRFDAILVEGQSQYGYCCWMYAEDRATLEGAQPGGAGGIQAPQQSGMDGSNDQDGQADFQDLGGGLGPYRPASDQESSMGFVLVGLGVLGAVAILRRRLL